MDDDARLQIERVKAAVQQIPVAVFVTVVNATVMATVLIGTEAARNVLAWLGAAVLIAAGRFAVWWSYRRVDPTLKFRRWSMVNTCGTFAAGLLWGAGSILLLPSSELYQLLWVFLIGGMCAGAASLHYPHLPTVLAFIVPASLPLAIRFALEGTQHHAAAAVMIVVFIIALTATSGRAWRNFGEMIRLRFALEERSHELDVTNERLRMEIAEHRAAEENLRQAQKMEAVGQLTGAIAHDFNNLLTAIAGSLELLRIHLPLKDDRAALWLNTAVQGAERGKALTQRLLAFGRRQPLKPEALDIRTLIRSMSALLGNSLGPGVRVAMHFPESLPPVEVDGNQLELALLNLAVNARDAMPEGGDLTISARTEQVRGRESERIPDGTYIVLSVADTGEGMDEATLSRAVEPFFTTKGVGKGTGLGLSMVHGFAGQSGGRFVLRSTQGVGTVAELWLPQAKAVVASVDRVIRQLRTKPTRYGNVLVVDDDPLVLASTSAMLEDIGYATISAESGREALELLRRNKAVDLVVTDYVMPGMTGLQLVEELHRIDPGLAVLLVSGYFGLESDDDVGLQRLSKPFGRQALSEAIDRCFATASLH